MGDNFKQFILQDGYLHIRIIGVSNVVVEVYNNDDVFFLQLNMRKTRGNWKYKVKKAIAEHRHNIYHWDLNYQVQTVIVPIIQEELNEMVFEKLFLK